MNDFREDIFDRVKHEYFSLYAQAKQSIEEIVSKYIKSNSKKFAGTSPEEYTEWLKKLMSGPKWNILVSKVAHLLYNTNVNVIYIVNKALPGVLADGASAYAMLIEQQLNGKTKMLPFTEKLVLHMISIKVLSLHNKKLNEDKDIKWNRTKIEGSKLIAALGGVDVKELPQYISNRTVNNVSKSMDVITRALVFGAINVGAYEAGNRAVQMGVSIEKTWLAIMDMNVRDSHKHLNGQTIPLDEMFKSFHGPIRFPHDPEAAAEEICGCRCSLAIHVKGKAPRYSKRRLLPTQVGDYRKWRDERIAELGDEVKLLEEHRRIAGW